MKAQRKRAGGFTLLELLMVVIIIAILASIALPQYLRSVARSRRAEALSVLALIRSAEARYAAEHQVYTPKYDDMDVEFSNIDGSAASGASFAHGSWTFDISAATTKPSVTGQKTSAIGLAGTTVNNCKVEMDLTSAQVTDTPAAFANGDTGGC